jgi:hypothetical protein
MKAKQPLTQKPAEHVEHLLDEALEETFPASDPIAVSPPRRGAERKKTWSVPDSRRHSGVT